MHTLSTVFNPLHSVLVDQIFLFSESDVIQTATFDSMQFMMAVQRGRTEGIFRLASDCCTAEFFSDFLNLLTSQTISYTVSDGRCTMPLVFITVFQRSRRPTRLSCHGP